MPNKQQEIAHRKAVVGIIGTRGLPNIHGGFERFTELLVEDERWSDSDIKFVVYGEKSGTYNSWTRQRDIGFTKDHKKFFFYFKSAFLATRECDIVLCCSVPLSIFAFWPSLNGKPLIMNPDGCEWRRTKWSTLGRFAIAAMYVPAILGAQRVVIDAEALRSDFRLGKKAVYIPYAAPDPGARELTQATKERVKLERPYMLLIARLEPENNVRLAVEAFHSLGDIGADLIVVGNTTTPHFDRELKTFQSPNVRFVGGIYDQTALNELRSNCIAYFHGHSVGGTNPSLLEALSTVRGRIFCHDNKYNREVAENEAEYFSDTSTLAARMSAVVRDHLHRPAWSRAPMRDARFEPARIFHSYHDLFGSLLRKSGRQRGRRETAPENASFNASPQR